MCQENQNFDGTATQLAQQRQQTVEEEEVKNRINKNTNSIRFQFS